MIDRYDAMTQTKENVSRKRLNPIAVFHRTYPRMQATQTIRGNCEIVEIFSHSTTSLGPSVRDQSWGFTTR